VRRVKKLSPTFSSYSKEGLIATKFTASGKGLIAAKFTHASEPAGTPCHRRGFRSGLPGRSLQSGNPACRGGFYLLPTAHYPGKPACRGKAFGKARFQNQPLRFMIPCHEDCDDSMNIIGITKNASNHDLASPQIHQQFYVCYIDVCLYSSVRCLLI